MEHPKIRLVYHTDKEVRSYFYLERTESLRVVAILKILPQLTKWTPVYKLAKLIKCKTPAAQSTVLKLAGAQKIDLNVPDKGTKTIAKHPILFIKKDQFKPHAHPTQKYLKPTIYVKHSR